MCLHGMQRDSFTFTFYLYVALQKQFCAQSYYTFSSSDHSAHDKRHDSVSQHRHSWLVALSTKIDFHFLYLTAVRASKYHL
jgi:hypothetical protein